MISYGPVRRSILDLRFDLGLWYNDLHGDGAWFIVYVEINQPLFRCVLFLPG